VRWEGVVKPLERITTKDLAAILVDSLRDRGALVFALGPIGGALKRASRTELEVLHIEGEGLPLAKRKQELEKR